jgi:hypothetical protein
MMLVVQKVMKALIGLGIPSLREHQANRGLRGADDAPSNVMARRFAPRPSIWITTPGRAGLVMTDRVR